MNWARLDSEFEGFAWKRLTDHEINPETSNGHEFQGVGGLADLLGREDRREVPADYYLLDDDDGNIIVTEVIHSTASWYDSRRNNPNRSAEWRLYYPGDAVRIQSKCSEQDLMVIGLRKDQSLSVMLIPARSIAETVIMNMLGTDSRNKSSRVQDDLATYDSAPVALFSPPPVSPEELSPRIQWVRASSDDVGLSGAERLEQLNLGFTNSRPPLPAPTYDISHDDRVVRLAERMLQRWPLELGANEAVMGEVFDCVGMSGVDVLEDPDNVLNTWLEVAAAGYRVWEREVLGRFLGPMRADPSIDDVDLALRLSERWMSFRQSRVSRAGRIMELCLERVLEVCGIRHVAQPKLPGNRNPDFIFPGLKEYTDESFPACRLRLLGAKTSMKERWRQILAEGDRVQAKHGFTRDDGITSSTFAQMAEARFTVVMPEPVISRYASPAPNLLSLRAFLGELRDLQAQ